MNQSYGNNFYNSGIAASQLNGTGSQVQANKLNLSRNAPSVYVKPGPVQIVEQPYEVVQVIKKPRAIQQAPQIIVTTNQLDPSLRNLIAETQAKIALLVMENNRIKWRIAQKDLEISRLRSGSASSTTGMAYSSVPGAVIRTSGISTVQPVIRTSGIATTTIPIATTGTIVRTSGVSPAPVVVRRSQTSSYQPVGTPSYVATSSYVPTSTISPPSQAVTQTRYSNTTTTTTTGPGAASYPMRPTNAPIGAPFNNQMSQSPPGVYRP